MPNSNWWTAVTTVDRRAATVAGTSTESNTSARLELLLRPAPYTARDGSCRASSVSKALSAGAITGYNSVSGSVSGLESALNSSPVSVTVDAASSWQSYRSGVLSESCRGQVDHAVIAVGYDGTSFKIRNSWGSSWGEAGYVRVSKSVSNPYCLWNDSPVVPRVSAD